MNRNTLPNQPDDDEDIGETFRAMREAGQEKRAANLDYSTKLLESHGIKYERLNEYHLRIGKYDFWPSTGKYLNRETKRYSRGVMNLLRQLETKP